ncbi:histidine kinase [Ideonella livida]|uniref:histidine kinase n=1 Tax=Ideonella livida TaxID=2707176 RepID=A0A7C9PK86_9BURK|nr:histidine kinase [Ideonella livida]NDY93092.1 hypothetical protein [Ideonella livida]
MSRPWFGALLRPRPRPLGLRWQLNGLLLMLMLLFTAALAGLRIQATRSGVHEEIVAANRVAGQLLERASWILNRGGPEAMISFLEQLGRVRANDIRFTDAQGRERYRSPAPTYKAGREAPAWFVALVSPPPQRQLIQVADGQLLIEADASRAVLDGWDELLTLAGVAAAMLAVTGLVAAAAVSRAVRPFGQISQALGALEQGRFATQLPPLPGREAQLIGEAVNRLGQAIEGEIAERMRAYQAERALAESRDWALRVQARLEAERKEIARELHDELGQSVTAMRSLARSLLARLPDTDPTAREAARLIDQEAARLYDAMHGLIPRLTPLTLDPLGLPDALADLVAGLGVRHRQLQWHTDLAELPGPVEPQVALAAYRVAQEAINNALKHSGASRIGLALILHPDRTLELRVDDNGCGLPEPDQRPARFGLTGLRERVTGLGGRFEAARRPDLGSRVCAQWPADSWPLRPPPPAAPLPASPSPDATAP